MKFLTNINFPSKTGSRALILDSSKNIAESLVTSTELGYLSGVTSAIQTQLGNKSDTTHTHSLAVNGDISGSVTIDNSADTLTLTLPNIATAGTYKSVTVNAKGQVTAGTNPTTISGYGITDAYTKTEINTRLHEIIDNFVSSGAAVTPTATALQVNIAGGVAYVAGVRYSLTSTNLTLTASTTQYIYVNSSGTITNSTTAPTGDYVDLATVTVPASGVVPAGSIVDTRDMVTNTNSRITYDVYNDAGTWTQIISSRGPGNGLYLKNAGAGTAFAVNDLDTGKDVFLIDGSGNSIYQNGASLYVKDSSATPVTKFSVDGATGNTSIVGTLGVTGNVTMSGTLGVTGKASVGSVRIGSSATAGQVLTADASGNGTWQSISASNTGAVSLAGYTTTNTSSTYANQYTKIASIDITSQYSDGQAIIEALCESNGSANMFKAKIYFRVKQQNALGAAPYIDLKLTGNETLINTDFVAVTTVNSATQTTVELYFRDRTTYNVLRFTPILASRVVCYSSQAYVAALPAGAQSACSYLSIDASTIGGVALSGLMQTSHAANAITGFGVSGSATTVSRSDHTHDLSGYSTSGHTHDHGTLTGLGDDDHSIYVKADGTRAFTGTVSGITPTASTHLATKGYVDSAILGLDWQESVKDKDLTAPPTTPATGDRYIVKATATGTWAGKENQIAQWDGAAWIFTAVDEGTAVWVEDEDYQYVWNGTAWVTLSSTVNLSSATGTVAVGNGGTGLTSYAVGDLIYASGATTLSKLADIATGNVLISGGVGAAPSYGKVGLTTHVSGTLAVGNGGTGTATAPTQGGVIYGSSTTAYASTAAGSAGQVLKSNGTSAPSWTTLDMSYLPDSVFKKSVKAATTADLGTVTATTTTLTGGMVVFPAQDGVTLAINDRLLVKNQTTSAQNGIYYLSTQGVASTTAWVLTRVPDADIAGEIAGAVVNVDSGTTNGGWLFSNQFKTTDTLGTTSMPWYRIVNSLDLDTAATANKVVLRDASGNINAAKGSFSSIRVGTSATAGQVLTADASGNATWQEAAPLPYYAGTTPPANTNIFWIDTSV